MGGWLVGLLGTFNGGWGGRTLNEAGWGSAGGVGALGATADGDGLDIGELDLDILRTWG
mgnify:FL=1